jgi:hypothetical protein
MNRRRALSQLARALAGEAPSVAAWSDVLALAGAQLLVPQLPARLECVRRHVPDDVWTFLEETRRRTRARNARLYDTLGDALTVLNAAGIEPILLKGCALWAEAPGPLASDRLISDLDLLVRPAQMQAAVDALVAARFIVLEDHRARRAHDVVVLGRASDVGAIDLHQRPPAASLTEALADLHEETRRVTFARGAARVPTPELQILVTAVHDQLHDAHFLRGGFDLRHLLDIAQIAKAPVDWARLAALCRTPIMRVALAAQLHAARNIAGADIPDNVPAGAWGAFHFWRQRAQFLHPWANKVFDLLRGRRGISDVLRWLRSRLTRRVGGKVGGERGGDALNGVPPAR